jgi:hypothetical protein
MSRTSQSIVLPKLVYVMGIDGSGKSTVSEHLARKFRENGYQVRVEWLRFNHVLSKPLLGLCRLIGLTRYEIRDGIRVGYHDFHRSKIISWLFVLFQYLDALRVLYLRVLPRIRDEGRVLILDRYVYDIMIDLMVDTRIEKLDETWLGRKLLSLLPGDACVIPIVRGMDEILAVRPECAVDSNFIVRVDLYRAMVERYRLASIHNNGSLDDLLVKVEKRVGLSQ